MAFTQKNLDALEAAIALGASEVQYTDRKVRYRDLSEMLRLRNTMREGLGLNKGAGIPANYPTFSTGFE